MLKSELPPGFIVGDEVLYRYSDRDNWQAGTIASVTTQGGVVVAFTDGYEIDVRHPVFLDKVRPDGSDWKYAQSVLKLGGAVMREDWPRDHFKLRNNYLTCSICWETDTKHLVKGRKGILGTETPYEPSEDDKSSDLWVIMEDINAI